MIISMDDIDARSSAGYLAPHAPSRAVACRSSQVCPGAKSNLGRQSSLVGPYPHSAEEEQATYSIFIDLRTIDMDL